jgi:EmrB/QacA subfamily drug resistance transporter
MARRNVVLVAMALGLLAIDLDFTMVNLGLAAMQRDLDTSLPELQWVVNAYTLALAGSVVVAGRLGDAFGRKRVYLGGVLLFAAAAIAAALAPSVGVLIGTRAIQGLGAATVYAVSLAILSDAFPPAERGRAIGIWTAVAATGLAAGPLVGGAVVEKSSWRWMFVLLVPIAAGSVALTLFAARESRDDSAPPSFDVVGAVVSALGLVALVTLLIQGGSWGLSSAASVALALVVIVAVPAFVLVERRARVPLLDLALFTNGGFLGAVVTSFTLAFVAFAVLFFVPLDFQHVRERSALASGLLLLPCTVTWALTSLAAGRVVSRIGTRVPMAIGLAITAAGLAVLAWADAPLGVVLVALGAIGTGIGLAFAPMTTAALNAVPTAKAGMASGALLMVRMVGASFGVAICGALFQWLEGRELGALDRTLSRADVDDATALLAGTDSARQLLERLPTVVGDRIVAVANDAFQAGFTGAMALAAGVAALSALLVFFLGRRAPDAPG